MALPKNTPVSTALREAGFVPLPRLWVQASDMQAIHQIANKYHATVNAVRTQFQANRLNKPNPVEDKDAAWAAYEKMQRGD